MKILVVDDSSLERNSIIRLCRVSGVKSDILEAENGVEALDILGENSAEIQLIILDWQMPVMDGLEFLRTIDNISALADMPIVMLTASGSQEDKDRIYDARPTLAGYLVKPCNPETFINTIRSFIK